MSLLCAAQRVLDNSYGTKPRHSHTASGAHTEDCIPCGIQSLYDALGGYSWEQEKRKQAQSEEAIPVSQTGDLQTLSEQLVEFSRVRGWANLPKNLAIALTIEASELLEPFQWLSEAESVTIRDSNPQAILDESADVLIYLLRLATTLGVDLVPAAYAKMDKNAIKYPAPPTSEN